MLVNARAALVDVTSPFGTYAADRLVRSAWRLADRHDLSAGLRKRIRALVARLFKGPYDTEIEGLRFRIYPGQNYDDQKILAKGRLPEQAEHRLLRPYLGRGTVFVDIGANVGSYTLHAAGLGAEVLAIEANPDTARKLAFNIAANGPGAIRLVNVAIGAAEATMALWLQPGNCGLATLVEDLAEGGRAGAWTKQDVPVRPLVDVLADFGLSRIDVIKIDVEGFEDQVLLPYLRATDRALWPRVILMETDFRRHWAEDCLPVLAALGYRVAGETDDNMVFELTS